MLPLLLLLLFIQNSCETSLEHELKEKLYRKCWKACQQKYTNSSSENAVLSLINDRFDLEKHAEHCRSYNSSKTCAFNCLSSPNHEYYLRPFIRQNYLNDFICVKHPEEFRKYLPCYRNHHSLEYFFVKCGYFALDDQTALTATPKTCDSLRCVTRYIPGLIRQECASGDQELAAGAGNLMERMVAAFLREKVRLNRMRRLCGMTAV